MRVRRGRVALGAVVLAVGSLAVAASPAAAGLSGPCTATIGGKNVADLSTGPTSTPVKVKENDRVVVTMPAPAAGFHDLDDCLEAALERGPRTVVLDMTSISQVSSATVAAHERPDKH